MLRLGSLFSGSGGFELGGLISGITPIWASEVEPFPIRVTTKRLPFVKHLGDIGMAIACEEYRAKFFANGANPSGVLEHPGTVKDPEKVRESWQGDEKAEVMQQLPYAMPCYIQ